MAIIELKNVTYTYRSKYQTVQVLHGITCGFESGQVYAIIGKSGSGKSTMLSLMAGLDVPEQGEVLFKGKSTNSIRLDTYRRSDVSVIYQNYRLFPLMTVEENVKYPMELCGVKGTPAKQHAQELILDMGLPDTVFHRFPGMLSGGEQQRVAIARALAMDTGLILADEPTGNLDTVSSENIIGILCRLAREKNYCVIIVTHDNSILNRMDHVYRMTDGILTCEK